MATLTLLQSVRDALLTEMGLDERVILMGEDVGHNGGVFRATEGLQKEFGEDRVMDTPLNESGIIGMAMGMAVNGLRPVPEIQFMDFIYPAFDEIVSEVAKIRYRSGGGFTCPMVIRTPYGGGIKGGHYHSQSAEAYFAHTAGLKVVIPSNPYDTKGLLIASIRNEDPVLFMEPKRLYRSLKGEVPEGPYTVELGRANIVKPGSDVTLICWGAMVPVCMKAAELCEPRGADCEVIDVRTLVPLDESTILESVAKTGRVVIVQEAPKTCGFGSEIAAIIAEQAILHLEGPIIRVTGFDTPFPYTLEHIYLPDAERVALAVGKAKNF
ncbi:MAG: alpha-ketoacid dehydrogenase subunit beta [Deltaproteobacteria bacterium]|nr:alpha-ketoacid dehydrogenase subunit beta [Deltaproteobacteria bacterium]MBI3293758.1 alpha-ketoacid dehydrogenase subunit beta [Deltaproteobacteria bacterium]